MLNPPRRDGRSLAWKVGAATFMIALCTVGCLVLLQLAYREAVHAAATDAVLARGRMIAADLAAHPYATEPEATGRRETFRDVVQSLARLEPSLQYVSVTDGGRIVFHEQLREGRVAAAPPDGAIRVKRRMLDFGTNRVPVVTFTLASEAGARSVQVALQRDALQREERGAGHALTAMLRAALLAVGLSFGSMLVVVVVLARRESRRETLRHEAEHLAFAGALANGVIHDMRNPLSSLGLDVQLLEKEARREAGARPERVRELAGRVRRTIDRVDNVLREFLHVSAPPGADAMLDLREALSDCVDLLRPRFERAGVRLESELGEPPAPLRGAAVQIKRAVINVLTNALQASASEQVVHLALRRFEDGYAIVVRDQGPGIPRRATEKVFDLFYTTKPGGTGLGLTLTRAAMEHHGGTVSLEPAAGGGTVVTLHLPAGREEDGDGA